MTTANEGQTPIRIDMIADLACPWCYLGLVRFDQARAMRPNIAVELRWWPYLLNPQLPKDGMDRRTYLRAKFGGDGQAREVYRRIQAAGTEDGVPFAFDRITRTPNTVLAQRLVLFAQRRGLGDIIIRTLFKAMFEDGIDIGKMSELLELGDKAGIMRGDIETLLAGDAHAADIIRGHQRAQMLGVQGVPVYVIGERQVIAGAQPPEVLAGMLDVANADAVA